MAARTATPQAGSSAKGRQLELPPMLWHHPYTACPLASSHTGACMHVSPQPHRCMHASPSHTGACMCPLSLRDMLHTISMHGLISVQACGLGHVSTGTPRAASKVASRSTARGAGPRDQLQREHHSCLRSSRKDCSASSGPHHANALLLLCRWMPAMIALYSDAHHASCSSGSPVQADACSWSTGSPTRTSHPHGPLPATLHRRCMLVR
jgi:hypothetical protein